MLTQGIGPIKFGIFNRKNNDDLFTHFRAPSFEKPPATVGTDQELHDLLAKAQDWLEFLKHADYKLVKTVEDGSALIEFMGQYWTIGSEPDHGFRIMDGDGRSRKGETFIFNHYRIPISQGQMLEQMRDGTPYEEMPTVQIIQKGEKRDITVRRSLLTEDGINMAAMGKQIKTILDEKIFIRKAEKESAASKMGSHSFRPIR